ncbi:MULTISPECIES: hypothetical protein [Bradyrhizobium]|uniref:Uncharacterized protein n=1 Tax=Bradyrhizobium nanningense TaxID=1325118 RepID=A0A4Q0S220_9BRAD|nr:MULTISPECIES: hypothetical protein [Bradyrhizobium]RXH21964.1 hypothetical protein XH84_36325 [Bradyrhizobium nanningense]RXH26551.1 hypothetical protein XH99_19480 [Bradyrhizobium nanningense]TQF29427.1 hypothetical protein UNPA324_07105 [Bradyrhizobium sp. UNPA324]
MGSIMLFKTLTLHSLIYIAGMTTAMAVHQAIPLPGLSAGPRSEQNADRSGKSDRLPTVQLKRRALDKEPVRLQPRDLLKPRKAACKPPIDVPGRCFAEAAPIQGAG